MTTFTIELNLDKKCKGCDKTGVGVGKNGYCLGCIAKMVKNGKLDHIIKKVHNNHEVVSDRGADAFSG